MLLDEATEGLAPRVRNHIWKSLEKLKAAGISILVIDKNLDALTRICDRHYIIEKGRMVWTGTSAELQSERKLRRLISERPRWTPFPTSRSFSGPSV